MSMALKRSDNKRSRSLLRRFLTNSNNLAKRAECSDDYDCFSEADDEWSYCGDNGQCVNVSVNGSEEHSACESDDECFSELANVWAYCGENGRCVYTEES
ncbi:DgyrCDS6788 [Dimorphilus gyrociliatus]|uniref:DgyrCDS6788 n=1 Tax=Dimorphilus gyrociliatus TaxID=2664684 RepID=A0A7I8VPP1_9ANNE|nr:DgyrCDS6788 [Dimorphilus gyrociliatus]